MSNLAYDPSLRYRYTNSAQISSSGGSAIVNITTDPIQGFYCRRHLITAFYVTAGKATAVVKSVDARDILLVSIKRNSENHTSDPIDIFSFNDECDDFHYGGYTLPANAQMIYTFSHQTLGGSPNWTPPFLVRVSLTGYHMPQGK